MQEIIESGKRIAKLLESQCQFGFDAKHFPGISPATRLLPSGNSEENATDHSPSRNTRAVNVAASFMRETMPSQASSHKFRVGSDASHSEMQKRHRRSLMLRSPAGMLRTWLPCSPKPRPPASLFSTS